MSSWREEYLYRLTRTGQTEAQVFGELAAIFRGIGFEYCSFGVRFPSFGVAPRESWSTTYPEHWQNQYLGHNYLSIDPVIGRALGSAMPIVWNDALFNDQRAFWEEARAHGVRHGWTMAMHGRLGETGLISLSRSDVAVSDAELADTEARLFWLSHTANGVIGNLVAQEKPPQVQHELTAREREVLRWTAAGKTSCEIGVILGIATRTVNFHITAILLKLDATNKTQAVVKAVMFDLLS
jgi:LuxR family transcriptional regulator, quorum-sensing system regulator SolR